MQSIDVRQLFEDYIFFRDQTSYYKSIKAKHPYVKDMKPTQERLAVLEEMAEWCKEKGIPPRQWLFSLFVVRAWNYAPSLSRPHLLSKKQLKRYSNINFDFYSSYIRKLENLKKLASSETGFDPNTDISQTTEQAKQYCLRMGGPEECRKSMLTDTFGFHPDSSVCRACPDSKACLEELQGHLDFDILALRSGRLTVQEAKRQAFTR